MAEPRQLEAIETDRLCMRPCDAGDVDALHALWTDPDVRRYLWDDDVIARTTAEEEVAASVVSFAADGFGICTVRSPEGDDLLGFCGLRNFEEPDDGEQPEILYGFYRRYWGHGYATEAGRAMLRFGFEELALPVIYAGTDTPNVASLRVLSRLGLAPSKELLRNGLPAIYALLRGTEFEPGAGRHELRWA